MSTPLNHSPIAAFAAAHAAEHSQSTGWQIVQCYTDIASETAVAQHAVALADQSANGKIRIEGLAAGDLLAAADLPINAGRIMPSGHVYRLRRDLYWLHTSPTTVVATATSLTAAAATAASLVTVTDVTHGSAELWLLGPAATTLLSRLCGLDFHNGQFPNLTAKQSSVAKTTQLIVRRDVGSLPTYALVGARSLAAYLWDTILEAGHDLGLQPIGAKALDQLQANP